MFTMSEDDQDEAIALRDYWDSCDMKIKINIVIMMNKLLLYVCQVQQQNTQSQQEQQMRKLSSPLASSIKLNTNGKSLITKTVNHPVLGKTYH